MLSNRRLLWERTLEEELHGQLTRIGEAHIHARCHCGSQQALGARGRHLGGNGHASASGAITLDGLLTLWKVAIAALEPGESAVMVEASLLPA